MLDEVLKKMFKNMIKEDFDLNILPDDVYRAFKKLNNIKVLTPPSNLSITNNEAPEQKECFTYKKIL